MTRFALIAGLCAPALFTFAAPAVAQQADAPTHVEIWQPGGKQPFKSFKPIKPARTLSEADCRAATHHRAAGKLPHHAEQARDCPAGEGIATAS